MSKDNSFGEKLKQIRMSRGLSQAKLAEMAVTISKMAFCHWQK